MKKNNSKVIIFYLALIAIIFVAVFAMLGTPSTKEKVNFSDIMHYFEEDRVKEQAMQMAEAMKGAIAGASKAE